jgi:hypothetical protein
MKILREGCRAEKARMISRIITICLHEFASMNRMRFFLSDGACLSNTPQNAGKPAKTGFNPKCIRIFGHSGAGPWLDGMN